jgi:hypothetical protein
MNLATALQDARSPSPRTIVALGGVAAGTFDLLYACTFWDFRHGVVPARILQSNAGDGGLPPWRWENLSHLAAHMLLVGVPCAVAARRALRGG